MKHIVVIFVIFIIGLLIISLTGYAIFMTGEFFIFGVDGNKDSNYRNLIGNYYLLKSEKTICKKSPDGVERVTGVVDSLNWSNQHIVGYSKGKYFTIQVSSEKVNYFNSKDSLNLSLEKKSFQNSNQIPSLK